MVSQPKKFNSKTKSIFLNSVLLVNATSYELQKRISSAGLFSVCRLQKQENRLFLQWRGMFLIPPPYNRV